MDITTTILLIAGIGAGAAIIAVVIVLYRRKQ